MININKEYNEYLKERKETLDFLKESLIIEEQFLYFMDLYISEVLINEDKLEEAKNLKTFLDFLRNITEKNKENLKDKE
jgi:hypothetical protein